MFLDAQKLFALARALHEARRSGSHACHAPRLVDGKATRFEPKPFARKPAGTKYPDGTTLTEVDGVRGIEVPHGPHGSDFLAIDPETGAIHCAACAKGGE